MAERKKGKANSKRESAALRQLDLEELRKKLAEEQENLMRARFQHATATLSDTALLGTLRHRIARIQTIIRQKTPEVRK